MSDEEKKELMHELERDITDLALMKDRYVRRQQYWMASVVRECEVKLRNEWKLRFVERTLENIKFEP